MKNKSIILSFVLCLALASACSDRMKTSRAKSTSTDSTTAMSTDTSKTSSYFYHQPQQGYK